MPGIPPAFATQMTMPAAVVYLFFKPDHAAEVLG
jgi:hypothetical protein